VHHLVHVYFLLPEPAAFRASINFNRAEIVYSANKHEPVYSDQTSYYRPTRTASDPRPNVENFSRAVAEIADRTALEIMGVERLRAEG